MGNLGPNWNRGCYLEVFSWTLLFNTNKKGAVSSNFLNFFIYALLFKWADVCWYFPGLSVVSETTMWHSRQASVNTFPHDSLFTKDDDSAKTATAQCCFWQKCFRHFRYSATSSFDRIYPWSKHCIGGWFGQILFLSAVFIVFHSQKQSTLIFVSRSIRPLWLQGLYLRTLFLGSKCWMHPRHIHPMGNLGPNWKRGC